MRSMVGLLAGLGALETADRVQRANPGAKIIEPTKAQVAAVEGKLQETRYPQGKLLSGAPGSTIQASDREYFVSKDGSFRRVARIGGKK